MSKLYFLPISRYALLLTALFLFTACSESTPPLTPISTNGKILAFGDSITFGTGANPSQSYPAVLQSLSKHKVINAGIPGELSDAGLRRLPGLIKQYQPDVLVLCHGGNDMLRKIDESKIINNIQQMVKIGQNHNVSMVLIGVPRPKIIFMKSAEFYKNIAQAANIPYQATVLAQIESDRSLKSDAIHPNAAGYKRLAESVHKLLLESGVY